MKLDYVGFRPIISQHGIAFKQGKDDKFIYLPYVYEIINALKNNYESHKNHSYNIKISKENISKLHNKMIDFFPSLDKEIENKIDAYKKHLDLELEDIEKRTHLSDIEKDIYKTNLSLMKDYRIKRAKNKIFYYYSVRTIAEIIKENRIKEINIPFNEKFWHVFKTLQGVLASEKINSNIKVEYIDSTLKLKFLTSIY
ncbi:hypothetical protein [Aliarcobacter vitoriensis]|uniref:Uncharacterized protein n=1 Tax=Aliarcobacter vitoriensis TaxID=2011099 RepID=A0A366MTJ9_9BACT|nr:hypothetical protein [Aliarcobacter vitoriensis]RBQ28722.1 hypothetical protein CRU91_07690 [Aliarcobacter vitoriensis]